MMLIVLASEAVLFKRLKLDLERCLERDAFSSALKVRESACNVG